MIKCAIISNYDKLMTPEYQLYNLELTKYYSLELYGYCLHCRTLLKALVLQNILERILKTQNEITFPGRYLI